MPGDRMLGMGDLAQVLAAKHLPAALPSSAPLHLLCARAGRPVPIVAVLGDGQKLGDAWILTQISCTP